MPYPENEKWFGMALEVNVIFVLTPERDYLRDEYA
jgi:hypothetical protein